MHTILLVDDDEDLIEMVAFGLRQFGFKVCMYSECTDMNQKIIDCQPNLILMDIFIGDVDGRKICFEIKNSAHQNIPIILYSAGNILPSSIKDSRADDFIQKPFNFSELTQKINDLAA